MIRRRRPEESPELKRQRLIKLARILNGQEAHDVATADGYNVGDVRERLARAQHWHCAYCSERPIDISGDDIEHFRPRSTYWWLTWTWENLWICCNTCQAKGSTFDLDSTPQLQAPDNPLDYTSFETWREQPMLLDPAFDDPQDHFEFAQRDNRWIWEPTSPRGKHTFDLLKLSYNHRPGSFERLTHHIQTLLNDRRQSIENKLSAPFLNEAQSLWQKVIDELLQSSAPYCAQTWWYFKHHHDLGQWDQYGLIMPDYPDDNPDAKREHDITLTMHDDYPDWLNDPALVLELHLALSQSSVTQLHRAITSLCRRHPIDLPTLARLLNREQITIKKHLRTLNISPDADNLYAIHDADTP